MARGQLQAAPGGGSWHFVLTPSLAGGNTDCLTMKNKALVVGRVGGGADKMKGQSACTGKLTALQQRTKKES